jgi:hypothetical protein
VWLPACSFGRPIIAVRVGGVTVDTYGSICLANMLAVPTELPAGRTVMGEGAVRLVPGAEYVPSLSITRTALAPRGTLLRAAVFLAP